MPTLTGTIENGSVVVPGKLVLTLANGTVKDTAPKKVFVPKPIEILCPDGVIPGSTTVEETETKFTSYLFEYFPRISTSPDVFSEDQLSPFPFYSIIPNIASVDLADLVPTGMVSDVLATGALRIAKIIANDPALAANIGGVFPKGAYNNSASYKRGDMVSYLDRFFIASEVAPFSGIIPTNVAYWMEIPIQPTGSVALGDSTTYGAGWDASGLAPSQDSVYDILEIIQGAIALKANTTSPTFAGNVIVPNQTAGSNNTRAANTAYVDTGLALKSDLTYVNTQLALKADDAATTSALALKANTTTVNTSLALKANLASPTFTGNPTAPTPAIGDNDTSLATTAFAQALCRPAFRVNKTTGTTTTLNYTILFNSEALDTNAAFTDDGFTCPLAGSYLFGGGVGLTNNDSVVRPFNININVNGTLFNTLGQIAIGNGGATLPLSSILIPGLAVGQIVTISVVIPVSFSYTVNSAYFWGFRLPV
ncbi:hypothetical protein [Anabaena sp. CCY 9402-a]|uniref:hypothetical protein n=1 Tax=Anabaena sp. CCY 9402-a TaxID=3103867 RepID=UPI0039C6E690